jgi:hypothetical protein
MARRLSKASLLAYDLRERGMKPELVILQALAAKPKASGATSHVVIKAERAGWSAYSRPGTPSPTALTSAPLRCWCRSMTSVYCAKPLSKAAR